MSIRYFLPVFLLLTCSITYAGWYECYNFKGQVGQYPVSLSFQHSPDYFGGSETKDLNITGCYKYDKFNTPIKIRGIWEQKNHVLLIHEMNDKGKLTAFFRLKETAPNIWRGTWEKINSDKKLEVEMHLAAQLNDTEKEYEFSDIEILQSASLPNYYFVGIYADNSTSYRAYMTALKIIRKKDNTVFQTLSFEDYFYDIGNVKTIIYDHVELFNQRSDANTFAIWCDAGRMGGYYDVHFDREKKQFIIEPEPSIEGGR